MNDDIMADFYDDPEEGWADFARVKEELAEVLYRAYYGRGVAVEVLALALESELDDVDEHVTGLLNLAGVDV